MEPCGRANGVALPRNLSLSRCIFPTHLSEIVWYSPRHFRSEMCDVALSFPDAALIRAKFFLVFVCGIASDAVHHTASALLSMSAPFPGCLESVLMSDGACSQAACCV
jgi:hypothetical protein